MLLTTNALPNKYLERGKWRFANLISLWLWFIRWQFSVYLIFCFWSGSLVAGTHTFLMWRSGVSGVRTPTPAYNIHLFLSTRGGKNTHAHGYPRVKSVTGMERVAKWVSTGIINGYLTTRYYMDTDTNLIVLIPTGTYVQ